ncbi:hypothetical protein [Moorena sp. SIO3H5]|uniref:hypothetical protein n=1 Tax=Moorena sp. SIO3H5 TaxID=2607834 RepID=UPI0013B9315B|nr:hypothetical protein [Moorena sp. SIO3H5]NEO73234.1 hypothetical protein [Moorena sp. SIO3H5]
MQRGLGGPPHERLHQDGSRERFCLVWVSDVGKGGMGKNPVYLARDHNCYSLLTMLLPAPPTLPTLPTLPKPPHQS